MKTALENLDGLDADALDVLALGLVNEIADIKGQIELATAKRFNDGVYADPDWFARAKYALRKKQAQHQATLAAKGRRRRAGWGAQEIALRFVALARQRLEPDRFAELWADALAGDELEGNGP